MVISIRTTRGIELSPFHNYVLGQKLGPYIIDVGPGIVPPSVHVNNVRQIAIKLGNSLDKIVIR